jgi:U2 small nuclear ribonucleoprotein A'
MRLTLDLLTQAGQSLNPASQRQIQLRGYKIPAIENLGSSDDAYECIDLSDNDLIKLGNFPPLKRLKILLLTNNRISRLAEDCFTFLPNLMSVVLTGNKLEKLVDLEPLTKLKSLERLSLLENPVTKVKHYRPYMINKCSKTLRILDFNRIKDKERKAAGLLFAGDRGKKLLEEIAPARTVGKEAEKDPEAKKVGPTPEVIERIKKAIAEAETIEEVTRLEKALKSGVLPEDLMKPEEPVKAAEPQAKAKAAPLETAEPQAKAKAAPAEKQKEPEAAEAQPKAKAGPPEVSKEVPKEPEKKKDAMDVDASKPDDKKNDVSKEELEKKTVDQLKELLREKGLKVSGNKQELVERLLEGDKQKAATTAEPAVTGEPSEPSAKKAKVAEKADDKTANAEDEEELE